ncbi:hypothetical protein PFISCL1PPCAC_20816, partial [Pristionchus fissidentatus]
IISILSARSQARNESHFACNRFRIGRCQAGRHHRLPLSADAIPSNGARRCRQRRYHLILSRVEVVVGRRADGQSRGNLRCDEARTARIPLVRSCLDHRPCGRRCGSVVVCPRMELLLSSPTVERPFIYRFTSLAAWDTLTICATRRLRQSPLASLIIRIL